MFVIPSPQAYFPASSILLFEPISRTNRTWAEHAREPDLLCQNALRRPVPRQASHDSVRQHDQPALRQPEEWHGRALAAAVPFELEAREHHGDRPHRAQKVRPVEALPIYISLTYQYLVHILTTMLIFYADTWLRPSVRNCRSPLRALCTPETKGGGPNKVCGLGVTRYEI